jgi:hypothetical protein
MIETIRIQNQMNCELICQKVHAAIMRYQKDNPDLNDTFVTIDIKKISQNIEEGIHFLENKLT